MSKDTTSRQRILNAAAELAFEDGAAHISLDAVAARAGMSKGGLLYNFPSKAALMRALVEDYLDGFRKELEHVGGKSNGHELAARYLELGLKRLEEKPAPSSGLLAALAEDPHLLEPVARFNRELLDRITDEAGDPAIILLIFLVLEGLRAQNVFGTMTMSKAERDLVVGRVASLLEAGKQP
ncbi:MAG: TetR/AcrR family transcriptional regulator [Nitratireductor sp.]|nr:TetR/AcrR family transcriptional regulator [Nitratireductor sp.]MCC0021010.1 TetR/AcrR family transcriptional regulator [Nitratireductor sp.]